MINFFVKSITASGKGKTTSTVEFIDGVNIIKGDSDTGKTKVISSILFAMGAKHKPFAQKTGYDTVTLVIGTPHGDITFSRRYSANLIEVQSENSDIEDGTYTTQYNTDRTPINSVWLTLMGIEGQPEVAKNKRSEKYRLTWNTLMKLFYIDEQEICRETSIIEPVQYVEKTLLLSSILYLIYGKDFSSQNPKAEDTIRKAKREIMNEYLNGKLSFAESQLERLRAYADLFAELQLQQELKATATALSEVEEQINAALESGRRIGEEIMALELELGSMNMLSNRYDNLYTQYESDIRRLAFVAEGEALLQGLEPVKHCPYCDSEIKPVKLPSFRKVTAGEDGRIRNSMNQLTETHEGLEAEQKELEKQLAVLAAKYEQNERLIKEELNPKKTEIEKMLDGYQEQIAKRSQYKIYKQMHHEIMEDLKKYMLEEPEKPEDYHPKEFFDADFSLAMNTYAEEILRKTGYPNFVYAHFDVKMFDLIINGGTKVDDHGKGYCAFINSVVAMMFRKYLVEHGTYTPGITIIDSPMHGMFQGVEDDAPESLKTGLFRYFASVAAEGQLIIAENDEHVPAIDLSSRNVRVIEFSKHDPSKRHGFLLDVFQ